MFQKKTVELFNDTSYVFGILAEILIGGFDAYGKDHDKSVEQVLHKCRQTDLKLNKGKCLFRCTCIPFFGKVISRHGVSPNPAKVKVLMDMPPPKNYSIMFSPMTT